jgi:putative membrane protein
MIALTFRPCWASRSALLLRCSLLPAPSRAGSSARVADRDRDMKTAHKFALVIWAWLLCGAPSWAAEPSERIGWTSWTWPPSIAIPLFSCGLLYCIGIWKMSNGRARAAVTASSVLYFAAGWTSLLIALDSPIHELGEQLFWAHMTQHEILMIISAPLLVIARPLVVFLWALPQSLRARTVAVSRGKIFSSSWALISAPVAAWTLHAAALWLWHAPRLFDATLTSDAMHAAQHISFLATALLFWWALIHGHKRRLGYGGSVLYVFTTAVHMSLLGALLTFSSTVWYAPYAITAPAWHFTGLEDQQLGGLIMWIPAGTVLMAVTLVLLVQWMRESEKRWQYTRTAEVLRPSPENRS